VRQIKLDAIPADIVESVEINKTLQANMDPDGIGGSVNLVTKTAGERPTINVSGMGGYTPIINGRGLVETAGTIGQRFGTNKRFGALIGGTYDWNGRGIDDLEPVPDIATLPGGGSNARYLRSYRRPGIPLLPQPLGSCGKSRFQAVRWLDPLHPWPLLRLQEQR